MALSDLAVRQAKPARQQRFPNKYKEAEALAEAYPGIAPWLPKPRRIWEPEPHNILLFEALALVDAWHGPNDETRH